VPRPWLRPLLAGHSPWMAGFAPGLVHVEFVVDEVTLRLDFLQFFYFTLSLSFLDPQVSYVGSTIGSLEAAVHRRSLTPLTQTTCLWSYRTTSTKLFPRYRTVSYMPYYVLQLQIRELPCHVSGTTGLSLQRPRFASGLIRSGFIVDKVALRQVFFDFFGFLYQYHSTVALHAHISPGGDEQ
jgi:hypothetical protein